MSDALSESTIVLTPNDAIVVGSKETPTWTVQLPVGVEVDGELVREARIKAWTAKVRTLMNAPGVRGKPLEESRVLLEQGVVSLAGKPFSKSALQKLHVPDWDFLRLAIRYVTFGNEVVFEAVNCGSCTRRYEPVIDLATLPVSDLNLDSLEWVTRGTREVKYAAIRLMDEDGRVEALVRIPQVKDVSSISDLAQTNQIAASNRLLCDCVEEFTYDEKEIPQRGLELVMFGEDHMEIQDWDALNTLWNEAQPGPDLWTSMACPVCDYKVLLNLEQSDFMNPTRRARRD